MGVISNKKIKIKKYFHQFVPENFLPSKTLQKIFLMEKSDQEFQFASQIYNKNIVFIYNIVVIVQIIFISV